MIMGGDKKKIATMIVARFGKPKDEEGKEKNAKAFEERALEPEMESDVDPGMMAGAEEVMAAMHSKDAAALAKSLQAFFQMCDAEPHVEGEHEEEPEHSILG